MNIPGNPLVIGWEGYFTSVVFFPKTHNSSLIMSKATDEATVGAVLQGADLCSSRASRLTGKKKKRKDWESVRDQRRSGRHANPVHTVSSSLRSKNRKPRVQLAVMEQCQFLWEMYYADIKYLTTRKNWVRGWEELPAVSFKLFL